MARLAATAASGPHGTPSLRATAATSRQTARKLSRPTRYRIRWYSPLTATVRVTAARAAAGPRQRRPSRWRSSIASNAHSAAGKAHHMTALKWLVSWNIRWGVQA